MVKLIARSAALGLMPIEGDGVTIAEPHMAVLTSLAPLRGQEAALSAALESAHGMALPKPNRATGANGARALWFGRAHTLLVGPDPDASLTRFAALTDQSDAWARLMMAGPRVPEMLAYMTPLDLREASFKPGHTARTELSHMPASLTRTSAETWEVMVFRSMAQTLVHDLKQALDALP